MSLLIEGPKQPGNELDVYLAPLIDDLKTLWNEGVEVFDGYMNKNFQLRAMLFCTISDFPAYANLSGCGTKGAMACPHCEDNTCSRWLKHCKKTVYMGHRRSLSLGRSYRNMSSLFDDEPEPNTLRAPLNGATAFSRVENFDSAFGKKRKRGKSKSLWKKKSIFWDLPYWKDLQVRHCIDVMHIEKNVCESLIGLLLNIPGKSRDGINARKDLVHMGIRRELAPQENNDGSRTYLPPACYNMSKAEKTSFCNSLHGIKVPSGYFANIKRLVKLDDMKLKGMKSHDCHVLMTQMIPVAIRGLLPDRVRHTITKLCMFFDNINSKVIDPEVLDSWQSEIILTLCQLEMYFPPSFFDIMVHLISHIVYEIKICGPVFLRYMYPFERYMGFLKGYVRNRYRPEGSIVEGYASEEVIEFCIDYFEGLKSIGVPVGRHEGRLGGVGTIGKKEEFPPQDYMHRAHFTVLQHMTCIGEYVNEHKAFLKSNNRSKRDSWLDAQHYNTFASWLQAKVENEEFVDEQVKRLAFGPKQCVLKYQAYDINGYTFYTKQQDAKSTMQNSVVTVIATTTTFSTRESVAKNSYYGTIEEIVELDYHAFKIPLFKCKWVENRRGVNVDREYGFTFVDLSTNGYASEPFFLARLATQVFFVEDPTNSRRHIVLHGKRCILGVENVVDEEEYDQFDELPPFSMANILSTDDVIDNAIYLRSDHTKGVWTNIPRAS
uniref:uncharacterized protein LOC122593779 n=1 Tax=Erigeron canadensis TaxID=72917 RepID=UPI001CB92BF0|nr:uncharacterized protein LOC122593779 [Erigeron canadensis]